LLTTEYRKDEKLAHAANFRKNNRSLFIIIRLVTVKVNVKIIYQNEWPKLRGNFFSAVNMDWKLNNRRGRWRWRMDKTYLPGV
jgi:hypothetical protein